jgi:TP901 family phage tail tape measure protein
MGVKFAVSTVFKGIDKTTKVMKKISRVGKVQAVKMGGFWKRSLRKTANGFNWLKNKAKKAFSGINTSFKKSGAGMKKWLAIGALAGGLTTFTLAAKRAITIGATFGRTIAAASAKFGILNKNTLQFKELEAAARKVGATTEFTASQAAQGLDFLAMAGFNSKQSIAALPGVVDLATTAGVDLAQATDIASDSLGAFGMMTKDTTKLMANMARVNDLYAATTTTSNTNMEMMFETMKKLGPVGTANNATIQEMAALTGTLANAGIKGADSGTALRNMYLNLAGAQGKSLKLLQKYRINIEKNGKMIELTDIIGQMSKKFKHLSDTQRTAVLTQIFGKRTVASVNILMKEGATAIDNYREKIEGMQGASKKMADFMRDTTDASFKTLGSTLESAGISLFKRLEPAILEATKGLTKFVKAVNDLVINNPMLGETLKLLLKILAPALLVVGVFKAVAAVKALIVAFKVWHAVIMANPIMFIVGLLIFAIGFIIANWDVLRPYFMAFYDWLAGIASWCWQKIKNGFYYFVEGFKMWIAGLKAYWLTAFSFIMNYGLIVVKSLLKAASYIPGIGDKAASALSKINRFQNKITAARNSAIDDVKQGMFNISTKWSGEDSNKLYSPGITKKEIFQSTEREQVDININDKTGNASLVGGDKAKRANFKFKRSGAPA